MSPQEKLLQFVDNTRCLLNNSSEMIILKDLKFTYVSVSQSLCDILSMNQNDFIAHHDTDLPWANYGDLVEQHDKEALSGKKLQTLEPIPIDKKNILTVSVIKSPIRCNNTGEIIGILGQGNILSSNNSFGGLLSALNIKDKKICDSYLAPKTYKIDQYNRKLKLTQRETECLFLLIRGKSAKEIGLFLKISFRTVEEYIEKIKNKMCVSSRSEIIAKAIESGMLEIIPKNQMLIALYKNANQWKDFF